MSYGEVLDQGRNICAAVDIPVIGDGDTGYGNAMMVADPANVVRGPYGDGLGAMPHLTKKSEYHASSQLAG